MQGNAIVVGWLVSGEADVVEQGASHVKLLWSIVNVSGGMYSRIQLRAGHVTHLFEQTLLSGYVLT